MAAAVVPVATLLEVDAQQWAVEEEEEEQEQQEW